MPRSVDHGTRRDEVCDAVVTLAADRGFAGVTVRAVAAVMGSSTSVVTHYVATRDELLRAAVRREVGPRRQQLLAAVDGLTGVEALRALVDWAVAGDGRRAHRFWLALVVGATTEPVLREELDAFDDWWDGLVARLVRDDPGLQDRVPVVVAGVGVLVDGLVLAASGDRGLPPPLRRQVVDQWLRGVVAGPGSPPSLVGWSRD